MEYYKVEVTYPNGEVGEIEEDFYSLNEAISYSKHILGQVGYNAEFHKGGASVQPFAVVKEYNGEEIKIVYDSRD